jgi:TAT (twin-arginine translocation) pathway-exported protein
MDRRDFLKGAGAGGVLGALPFAAHAAFPETAGDQRPLVIVHQADIPQAAELANGLRGAVAPSGRPTATVALDSDELRDFSRVVGVLGQWPQARFLGVMDYASATIFQEIAAARGAGYAFETHHRFAGQSVRLASFVITT